MTRYKDDMGTARMTSRQVAPFQALMNMIKVNYFAKSEVFRALIAVLCDYDITCPESFRKTSRYISVLLGDSQDLADCLITFLPHPSPPPPPLLEVPTPSWHPPMVKTGLVPSHPAQGTFLPQAGDAASKSNLNIQDLTATFRLQEGTCRWCAPMKNENVGIPGLVRPNFSATMQNMKTVATAKFSFDRVTPLHPFMLPHQGRDTSQGPGIQSTLEAASVRHLLGGTNPSAFRRPLGLGHLPAEPHQLDQRPLDLSKGDIRSLKDSASHLLDQVRPLPNPVGSGLNINPTMKTEPNGVPPHKTLKNNVSSPKSSGIKCIPPGNTPLSHLLNMTAAHGKGHSLHTLTQGKHSTDSLELSTSTKKVNRLKSKPGRELESLKELTGKLKLAEKKIKLSQQYAKLFHPTSPGPVGFTSTGIPFQVVDSKMRYPIQETAKNLTSFPYIQRVILPDGEMRTLNFDNSSFKDEESRQEQCDAEMHTSAPKLPFKQETNDNKPRKKKSKHLKT
ncbi:uncharacterized protein LOC124289819 [Haliotis rubra]|uniref:uncharacterized protein LOC124289819 n=1 Tax=Haliotis rubra TaxID=36100 RepID=UPI001EE59F45|nr:uncharacterized protein LOC124289819 [Haliotis rubra]